MSTLRTARLHSGTGRVSPAHPALRVFVRLEQVIRMSATLAPGHGVGIADAKAAGFLAGRSA